MTHRESLAKMPPLVRHGIFLGSLTIYIFAHLIPSAIEEGVVVVGACGIIFSALAEPGFSKILRLPLFQFLGQISYSIYLRPHYDTLSARLPFLSARSAGLAILTLCRMCPRGFSRLLPSGYKPFDSPRPPACKRWGRRKRYRDGCR